MRAGLLLLCSSLLLFAQSAPSTAEKGVLAGKVLNSATGEPVRKAQVSLLDLAPARKGKAESPGGGGLLTDAAGRFEFKALAPGAYALAASRDGFATPNGLGAAKMQRITLAPGEEQRDVVVRLTPLGVISGRVLDEDGDPLRRIEVRTMVYRYSASGRQLSPRDGALTDDLGEYRIFDVQPGRYYLKAGSTESMGVSARESYGTSYYPGTPDSAAAPIEVGAGQQVQGIDLTLRPTRVASIRGRVMNPGSNLMVGLMKFTEAGSGTSSMGIDNRDGKFELHASPGAYVLTAGSTIGGQHYSAHLPIQVGTADMEGIELRLLPPMEIAGQIRVEGKTSDRLSHLYVVLESEGRTVMGMAGGGPKEDGSFAIQGLEPGVYQVSAQAAEGLYLKAVRWSDRDVMQSGLDLTQGAAEGRLLVVLSAAGGQVDGVVEDDRGAPAVSVTVSLVPSSGPRSKSLFKWAMTNPNGRFHMQGIAPGSYKVLAWEDVDSNQVMYDPDFLKPFDAQAQSLEMSEGSRKSVQLKLIKAAAEKEPSP